MRNLRTMKKVRNSTSYDVVWAIKDHPKHGVTSDGVLLNIITGKPLQRSVKGYTIGYYLNGRFYSISQLRKMLTKFKYIEMPF